MLVCTYLCSELTCVFQKDKIGYNSPRKLTLHIFTDMYVYNYNIFNGGFGH